MKLTAKVVVTAISFLYILSAAVEAAEQAAESKTNIRTSKALSGEELYPGIKRLELEQAREKYTAESAIFIDARNSYEYGTMQIKGAANVSVNDHNFVQKIREIREADKRPIIFYCNGLTCMKSFKAAKLATDAGVKDIFVYPYGILSWAKAHPDDALLFGQPLKADAIINDDNYKAKKLSPEEFFQMREKLQDQAIVIDIRTLDEVSGVKIWPGIQYNVKQENESIKKYIDKARAANKTLLIYDESGHQIRWVQYYMRKVGFNDYYLLDGGHENYMRMIDKDGKFVMSEYMRERMKAQSLGGQID